MPDGQPRLERRFAGMKIKLADRSWAVPAATVLVSAYLFIVFVQPQAWMGQSIGDGIRSFRSAAESVIFRAIDVVGLTAPRSAFFRHGLFLLVYSGLLPWLVMVMLGRGRLSNLGLRCPNAAGWRILLFGFFVAFPIQVWMVQGSEIGSYYLGQFRRSGLWLFCGYYLTNMLTEHFLFHGIMLALFRRGFTWPTSPPVDCSATNSWRRALQWVGLAQPVHGASGWAGFVAWCGLPQGCVFAVVMSGILFGAVHIGKDPRELILSLPGGLLLAYLAYRTNGFLIPLMLHLATASTAFLLIVAME